MPSPTDFWKAESFKMEENFGFALPMGSAK